MTYYQLRCCTCGESFWPVVATNPNELLAPDFEQMKQQAGSVNADLFHEWFALHSGHDLQEIPLGPESRLAA
jgi:hypothetical protein